MRRLFAPAFVGLLLVGTGARAQDRFVPSLLGHEGGYRYSRPLVVPCPPPGVGPYLPGVPGVPVDPNAPRMDPPVPPPGVDPIMPPVAIAPPPNPLDGVVNNPSARLTEAGGLAPRTFNENFDGDFGGIYYKQSITTGYTTVPRVVGFTQRVTGFTPVTTTTTTSVPGQNGRLPTLTVTNTVTTVNTPIIVNDPIIVHDVVAQQRLARLTLAGRYSGVFITDNDNPRPQDRIYGGYNFYDNIGGSLNPGLPQTDLQRQTAGFEKTFLGGDASFGMRLPFVQQYGGGAPGTNNIGDLSLLVKYAFYNNRETGDVLSGGLVLTVPTGSGSGTLADGSRAPHSLLFQPWVGFVQSFDRAFVQGITSFVIPTDDRDPTLWNNSIGAGYYVYRNTGDAWLTSVAPVVEVHVRTPLTSRSPSGLVYLQDQVNITSGIHFRFNRATLSTSVCVPVAGPRPWAVEAMTFFNYNF